MLFRSARTEPLVHAAPLVDATARRVTSVPSPAQAKSAGVDGNRQESSVSARGHPHVGFRCGTLRGVIPRARRPTSGAGLSVTGKTKPMPNPSGAESTGIECSNARTAARKNRLQQIHNPHRSNIRLGGVGIVPRDGLKILSQQGQTYL